MPGERLSEAELGKAASAQETFPEDSVHRMDLGGKSVVLIGTAHLSGRSADLVTRLIEEERPEVVCVELCAARYEHIARHGLSGKLSLLDLLREQRGHRLLWLMLWYLQKRVGERLGVRPGVEMMRAIEGARALGASIYPVDRDIRTTLERVWKLTSLKTKVALAAQLFLSLGQIRELREEDIERSKREEWIEKSLEELGRSFPVFSQVLLDERDLYMAQRIAASPGQRIVAIVGAAHVPGILRRWSLAEAAHATSQGAA